MSSSKEPRRQSISSLLRGLVKKHQNNSSLNYGELVATMGEQAYGLIIILFALPSALPIAVIPGFSFIFGLPIVFIAIHILIARPVLWLPTRLAKQPIEAKKLVKVINKTRPYLSAMEHLLKPRWSFLFSALMERFLGFILLVLSLLLLLPIPFSNFIFAGLIILLGLGLSEKDGVFVSLAYLGSLVYFLFLSTLTRGLMAYFAG